MSRGSIRARIMMGLLVMVTVLGGILTVVARDNVRHSIARQLDERAASLARGIAGQSVDMMITGDDFGLAELLRTSQANNADVRYIFILDRSGRVLASTFGRGFPRGLVAAHTAGPAPVILLRTEEGLIHDAAAPIPGTEAGTVRVGLSEQVAQRAANATTARLLAAVAGIFVVGAVAAYQLVRALTQPLARIVEAAGALAAGDLTRRARIEAEDEIGLLARAFDAMAAKLQGLVADLQRKEQNRALLLRKVITAQEEERKRVARELHDQTGQSLTSLVVGLRALEGLEDPGEMRRRSAALRAVAAEALNDVQYLSRFLRPSVLDDLGLVPALDRYIGEVSAKFGIDVDLHVAGLEGRRLPREVETALYRIIQEALTNVARHAGAGWASVVLERRRDAVVAIVEDGGGGFDPEGRCGAGELSPDCCLGLFGMRERATLVGGALTLESRPGEGTSVIVTVPLDRGEEA